MARLGRREEGKRLTEANIEIELELAGPNNLYEPQCQLVLSSLSIERSGFPSSAAASSADLWTQARDWALGRDAKEVLCWSYLVEAQHALAKVAWAPGPCGEPNKNREIHGPGAHATATLAATHAAVESGLKIARDCGYGLFHIDLLLERARLHLLRGDAGAALDDIEMALGDSSGRGGIPANEETGQVELLAANHAACGYAWPIPAGLQLRAEAQLLQAAQIIGEPNYKPRSRKAPAEARDLIKDAKSNLRKAMTRWKKLRDPEPTEDNNFQLDGKEYNYKAQETHRIIQEVAGGILTHYPHTPKLPEPHDEDAVEISQQEKTTMSNFDVFLSHNSKDKPDVKRLGEALKQRGLSVWLDEWELAPGSSWIDELENIVTTCGSSAVCVGENGLGPWEEPEMQALLIRFMKEKEVRKCGKSHSCAPSRCARRRQAAGVFANSDLARFA